MRKEYESGDVQYNFSEDISKDLIEVRLFNPNVFDFNRDIVVNKDGVLTELDLINQIDDAEYYLEGVNVNQLVEDIGNDLQDHIQLNKLQESIKYEVGDFKYDISNNKSIPHTNFNLIIEDNKYNLNIPIYEMNEGVYRINDDNYGIAKIRDMSHQHSVLNDIAESLSEKYGEEIARDTVQKVVLEANKCIKDDSPLIQEQKQDNKQKKSKSFGMSM